MAARRSNSARAVPLRTDRPPGPQLAAAILRQVDRADDACAVLLGTDSDAHVEAVHRLRRAAKRIRAWLTTVEHAESKASGARVNASSSAIAEECDRWRAIMSACSPRRDLDVAAEVIDRWRGRIEATIDEDGRAATLVGWLDRLHRDVGPNVDTEPGSEPRSGHDESAIDVASLRDSIAASRAVIDRSAECGRDEPAPILFDALDWPGLVRAVARSWRAARRSRRAWVGDRHADEEHLHVTRKRAARLLFQLELVEGLDRKRVKRWRRRLRSLTNDLGAYRDERLAHALAFERLPAIGADTPSLALLHEFTDRRDRRARRALARRARRALRGSARKRARRLRKAL